MSRAGAGTRPRRRALALAVLLAALTAGVMPGAAVAQPGAAERPVPSAEPPDPSAGWLARPDAPLTLVVSQVGLAELLTFVAAVGGTEVRFEDALPGQLGAVSFTRVRAEDAFRSLVSAQGLVVRRQGDRLVIARAPRPAPPVPLTPDRGRPELIVPPTP